MYYTTYITLNKITNKRYFGVHKTENVDDGYIGSGTHLIRSVKKYGKENFEIIERKFYNSYADALSAEEEFVTKKIVESSTWYNLRSGGYGGELSDETRQKIKNKRKYQIITEETGRKISEANKGNVQSKETRKKISDARRGMQFTEEHKYNISEGHKGQTPWNKGLSLGPMSDEQKKKISDANKGKKRKLPMTQEHKDKIKKALTGRTLTEEHKESIRRGRLL